MAHQRMRAAWQSHSVSPEASLRETMTAIDRGRLGIALVVDADGRLLGTVTDGDSRRAILRGVALEAAVDLVMNRNFTAMGQDITVPSVLELMRAHSIKQIPVLDARGCVIGLYYLPDLVEPSLRPNWAVIMAGGEGRRLRPLTSETPKPMQWLKKQAKTIDNHKRSKTIRVITQTKTGHVTRAKGTSAMLRKKKRDMRGGEFPTHNFIVWECHPTRV